MTPFAAVSQTDLEMELVDIAGKDIWVSKFIHLTADFEAGAHQKAFSNMNFIKNKQLMPYRRQLQIQFEDEGAMHFHQN